MTTAAASEDILRGVLDQWPGRVTWPAAEMS
jgi:hypothetical protein